MSPSSAIIGKESVGVLVGVVVGVLVGAQVGPGWQPEIVSVAAEA